MRYFLPPLLSPTFWICWTITCLNAVVSAGYATTALLSQGDSNVYTQYAASRSFALVIVVLVAGWLRSSQALLALAAVMTLVQLGDAVIGFYIHDAAKSFGPLGVAVLTFFAALFLRHAIRQLP